MVWFSGLPVMWPEVAAGHETAVIRSSSSQTQVHREIWSGSGKNRTKPYSGGSADNERGRHTGSGVNLTSMKRTLTYQLFPRDIEGGRVFLRDALAQT